MPKKDLYSTAEVAKILNLSRVEIFRKIKNGKIKAEKIGRNFVIHHDSLTDALGRSVGHQKRGEIEKAIEKALSEYGEAFRKLGKE